MPSAAAMTVAVVQAIPLVVKTRLYGAFVAGELVGTGRGAPMSPSSPPVISSPR